MQILSFSIHLSRSACRLHCYFYEIDTHRIKHTHEKYINGKQQNKTNNNNKKKKQMNWIRKQHKVRWCIEVAHQVWYLYTSYYNYRINHSHRTMWMNYENWNQILFALFFFFSFVRLCFFLFCYRFAVCFIAEFWFSWHIVGSGYG